jgi:hypothetical protein
MDYLADPSIPRSILVCGLMLAEVSLRSIPEESLEAELAPVAIRQRLEEAGESTLQDPAEPLRILACGTIYARYRAAAAEHRMFRDQLGEMATAMTDAAQDSLASITLDAVLVLVDALGEWLAGDPQTAYRALIDFPDLDDPRPRQIWFGQLLLDLERADEAIPYFRAGRSDPMSGFYLGQAYEALGQDTAARDSYGYFLTWWADADPELQPLVEQAREALVRISDRLD